MLWIIDLNTGLATPGCARRCPSGIEGPLRGPLKKLTSSWAALPPVLRQFIKEAWGGSYAPAPGPRPPAHSAGGRRLQAGATPPPGTPLNKSASPIYFRRRGARSAPCQGRPAAALSS